MLMALEEAIISCRWPESQPASCTNPGAGPPVLLSWGVAGVCTADGAASWGSFSHGACRGLFCCPSPLCSNLSGFYTLSNLRKWKNHLMRKMSQSAALGTRLWSKGCGVCRTDPTPSPSPPKKWSSQPRKSPPGPLGLGRKVVFLKKDVKTFELK